MDLSTAICIASGMAAIVAIAAILSKDREIREREKHRALIIENARLRAMVNALETDQHIACGYAIEYDEIAKRRIEDLKRQLECKDALLRQKWRNAR